MGNGRELSKEQIESIAQSFIGKTFGEFQGFKKHNKGGFGLVIEEDGFGYAANSDAAPDFRTAHIELKVTPYKKNKNGSFSSKERLVLNIINYMNEYKYTFYTSSFWKKNENLLILFYFYKDNIPPEKLKITHKWMLSFSEEDLEIIIDDWKKIVRKIMQGLAHEISEADTMYLGACTKGVNRETLREQPFSKIKAKQRAFSLKTTYMSQLVRELISGRKTAPIVPATKIKTMSFEDVLLNELSPYYGKTQCELKKMFNIHSKAKNINELLISRMLGVQGKISNTSEFIKANIVPKTIRVEKNGKIRESMSFPHFKYTKIVNETWEDSEFKSYFETTKFLFLVFRSSSNQYIFENAKFWNMPLSILENEGEKVWKHTVRTIMAGNIIQSIDARGRRKTNFLSSSDTQYFHLRPHARNAQDECELPVRDKLTNKDSFTKYCFWLNNSFVSKIIK
jgi:DNA mismatch repair protein MutH